MQGSGGEQCAQDIQHGGSHHASLRPQWRGIFSTARCFCTNALRWIPSNNTTLLLRIYTKYWKNNDAQVYTGKFHPSGDILASSGFDRQIFLWKVYGEHHYNIELDSSFVFFRNHSN